MTPEEIAAQAAKEAADKAAADLAAADPEALRKQIAILNSENAARRHKEKELADQLEKFNAEKRTAEEKALAEKGEFKGLYEALKAESEGSIAQLAAMEGTLGKLLESEIEAIPEAQRVILDQFSTTQAKLDFIATAKATKLFSTPSGPGVRESGEHGNNAISRQAFDSLQPAAKQKHLADGGKIHD